MISVLAVRNFRNYDLLKNLLIEILGQIHLQPKLTWLSDAFGHPKRQKRPYTTKVFSYLLCVIGKLNMKLSEQINKYHTDVCFQFHPINSIWNNVSHNKTINYPVH